MKKCLLLLISGGIAATSAFSVVNNAHRLLTTSGSALKAVASTGTSSKTKQSLVVKDPRYGKEDKLQPLQQIYCIRLTTAFTDLGSLAPYSC
jgi:hypothetical protein